MCAPDDGFDDDVFDFDLDAENDPEVIEMVRKPGEKVFRAERVEAPGRANVGSATASRIENGAIVALLALIIFLVMTRLARNDFELTSLLPKWQSPWAYKAFWMALLCFAVSVIGCALGAIGSDPDSNKSLNLYKIEVASVNQLILMSFLAGGIALLVAVALEKIHPTLQELQKNYDGLMRLM